MTPTSGYTIRLARPSDVPLLPSIEDRANALFDDWSGILGLSSGGSSQLVPVETLATAQQAGHLWVAADSADDPVGFALVSPVDDGAHLDELDVLPEHGRRGLGSALVETVVAWAGRQGYGAVTLTTFRDIPWNAPLYERLGFRIIGETELGPGLARIIRKERDGRFRADLRVAMRREI